MTMNFFINNSQISFQNTQDKIQTQIAAEDIKRRRDITNNRLFYCHSELYLRNQALSRNQLKGLKLIRLSHLLLNSAQSVQVKSFKSLNSPASISSHYSRDARITSVVHSSMSNQKNKSKIKLHYKQAKTYLKEKINNQTIDNSIKKQTKICPTVKNSDLIMNKRPEIQHQYIKQSIVQLLQKQDALDLTPLKNILKMKRPQMRRQNNFTHNGHNLSKLISQKAFANKRYVNMETKMMK